MRWMAGSWGRWCGAAALLLVLLVPLPVRAEDDPAASKQRYARDLLRRRARESVDPGNPAAGGLEDLKKWLDDRRARLATTDREMLARADRLLGRNGTREGIIRQAAMLYRWVAGKTLPGEDGPRLGLRASDSASGLSDWPAKALDQAEAAALEDARTAAPPVEGPRLERPKQAFERLPESLRERILEDALVVARRADGTIAVNGIDALRVPDPDPDDPVLVLSRPDELDLGICRPWVEARERQVAPRVRLYNDDAPPPGLVSEGTVRDKAKREAGFRERAEVLTKERLATEAALDRLVAADRKLTEHAGRLGFQIEESRRALTTLEEHAAAHAKFVAWRAAQEAAREAAEAAAKAAPKDVPKKDVPKKAEPQKGDPAKEAAPADGPQAGEPAVEPPVDPGPPPTPEAIATARSALDSLVLEEIVGEQRLRLLYIAVRRAEERLALYTQAIRQVKLEEAAARGAAQRYEVELSRMRRERQLDRLLYEQDRLAGRHEEAKARVGDASEAERPLWVAYEKTLLNLMSVNGMTREAVGLRRELEKRAKPPLVEDEPPPVPLEPGCEVPEAGHRFQAPRRVLLEAKDADEALAALREPGWSGDLVAEHYEVVDERIAALDGALASLGGLSDLEGRAKAAAAAAHAGLDAMDVWSAPASSRSRWFVRKREAARELDTDESGFAETLRGIEDLRRAVTADRAAFARYRASLLDQGPLSFQIRVDRRLDPERLGAALEDVEGTVGEAGRWLTLQGEEHGGTFVERHWSSLLACLAVLAASVLVVRFGRRGLDGLLRGLASRVPALRAEPVTVRAEEAQAKREKAVQEAAAKAAEADALREVSAEEAARPQKMGEGGYGGGDEG